MTTGTKLNAILNDRHAMAVRVGQDGCQSLTVEMVEGQMSYVPWVREVRSDGPDRLHNSAMLVWVEFAEEREP